MTTTLRDQFIALPILTVNDPDDAYGVNSVDYVPRKEALAIIDAQAPLTEPRQRITECPECGEGFKEFAGDAGRCSRNHVVSDTWQPSPQPTDNTALVDLDLLARCWETFEHYNIVGDLRNSLRAALTRAPQPAPAPQGKATANANRSSRNRGVTL